MASHPAEGLQALRDGTADRWLRRGIGDAGTATRIEERVRGSSADAGVQNPLADASLLMQAVSVLDPLAPLCWRGIAVWPDGLGPALAAVREGPSEIADRIEEIVDVEAARIWASARPERCDVTMLRVEARQQRATLKMRGGGRPRLLYALNLLQPCTSPLLDGRCVARMQDLLPALEAAAARLDHAGTPPLDPHLAAFIAVRSEEPAGPELFGPGPGAVAAQLRLLTKLQARFHPHPLPGVAAWLAAGAGVLVSTWRNKNRRDDLEERLRVLAGAGQLGPMLAMIDDPGAHARDAQGAAQAAQMLARADAELHRLATGAAERVELARRLGQEIAAGSGLAALVAVLGFAALG
jgi:eukaryotic-like serine/threonine-protein kinase